MRPGSFMITFETDIMDEPFTLSFIEGFVQQCYNAGLHEKQASVLLADYMEKNAGIGSALMKTIKGLGLLGAAGGAYVGAKKMSDVARDGSGLGADTLRAIGADKWFNGSSPSGDEPVVFNTAQTPAWGTSSRPYRSFANDTYTPPAVNKTDTTATPATSKPDTAATPAEGGAKGEQKAPAAAPKEHVPTIGETVQGLTATQQNEAKEIARRESGYTNELNELRKKLDDPNLSAMQHNAIEEQVRAREAAVADGRNRWQALSATQADNIKEEQRRIAEEAAKERRRATNAESSYNAQQAAIKRVNNGELGLNMQSAKDLLRYILPTLKAPSKVDAADRQVEFADRNAQLSELYRMGQLPNTY